jgi:hypothetical protein
MTWWWHLDGWLVGCVVIESWDGCFDCQYQLGGCDEVDGFGGEMVEVLQQTTRCCSKPRGAAANHEVSHEASNLLQLENLLRMSHSGGTLRPETAVAATQCDSQSNPMRQSIVRSVCQIHYAIEWFFSSMSHPVHNKTLPQKVTLPKNIVYKK